MWRLTHNQLPYTQNWNFGIQYALPAQTVLEINYVGNKGTRLAAARLRQPERSSGLDAVDLGDILPRPPWTAASDSGSRIRASPDERCRLCGRSRSSRASASRSRTSATRITTRCRRR